MERLPLPARIVRPLGYPTVGDLPKEQQEGLRAFWLDGLFAAVASGFSDPYYTLYLLSSECQQRSNWVSQYLNTTCGSGNSDAGRDDGGPVRTL